MRGAWVAGLMAAAGVAVGTAGVAAAEQLSGTYTVTVVEGGGVVAKGTQQTWTFSSCGSDCSRVENSGVPLVDLHRQGGTWTGLEDDGCTITIEGSRMRDSCVPGLVYQLSKG